MNGKNQIEEMKCEVCICCSKIMDCHEHLKGICGFMKMIEMLYDIGYRKQIEAEWIIEAKHFFDDDGDLLLYAIAHCSNCNSPYRDKRNVNYERIERPENLDYHEDWNVDIEPLKQTFFERAKTVKLSHNFCPNCGAKMKGGA